MEVVRFLRRAPSATLGSPSANAVRARFYDLVLRADVGNIDVSWADREEHRQRVELLTRQRATEIQALDDEFQEIMDEPKGGTQ